MSASRRPAEVVRRLPAHEGQCYVTFDDGPDPVATPALLDVLAALRLRATFFVIGELAARHGAILRAARAAGHGIGSHSWSHRHPWLSSRAVAHREVRDGVEAVADALGERPAWYRPPHGRLSPSVRDAARESGQRIALWSVSAVDWGPFAATGRIAARLGNVAAGDIVLLHDGPLRHNRPDRSRPALPGLAARLAGLGVGTAPLPAATIGG